MRFFSTIFAGLFVIVLMSCNSSGTDQAVVDADPFPRLAYKTVKVISIDRAKEQEGGLKRMRYLSGNEATGIIDSLGTPVTDKIKAIELTAAQTDTLKYVFRPTSVKPAGRVTDGDCIPAYRDAIVFYDSTNKPVAWVNICFTCEKTMFYPASSYMHGFDLGQDIELRNFFKKLGYVPEGRP